MIDLRSDTVTRPGREMLDAMLTAKVGDDVFKEDPTVNLLEARVAEIFGHEAGLFCPSGTMTNQIAIQAHTRPGDEVICHELSHVYHYEGGGIAKNALSSVKLVRNDTATMHSDEVDALVNQDQDWLARTSLVVAEDTSNRGGGKCYMLAELQALAAYCKAGSLAFHLDGARVFNAIVRQGHDPVVYGACFDSISVCLSKGLGAPVGSVLVGPADFIARSRRIRKAMGGGMRQAGFLAAAGIFALDHHIDRLADDHRRAARLANACRSLGQVDRVITPETNIVLVDVVPRQPASVVLEALAASGVLAVPFGKYRIRLVTHLDISDPDIDAAIKVLGDVLG